MNLRHIFLLALTFAGIASIRGTQPDGSSLILNEIKSSGQVNVVMPDGLEKRLIYVAPALQAADTIASQEEDAKTRVGYRIQVYDNNNVSSAKSGAEAYKDKIETRFPEYSAYVQFHSPYWRVKVGDFTTRSEAEVFMEIIREEFPETSSQLRVVRDRINLEKE